MGMNKESIALLELNYIMIKSQMLNSINVFRLIKDCFQYTYKICSLCSQ